MQQQMYFQQQAQYLQGNGYYPLQVIDGWMIKLIASSDNVAFVASLLLVRCGHTSSHCGSEL